MCLYEEERLHIYLALQDALLSIYNLCDSWTLSNVLGIFEIVGHFTDKEERWQALLLTLVDVKEVYTAEKLALHMFIILDQYYIKDCFRYCFIDNATANHRMVTSISD